MKAIGDLFDAIEIPARKCRTCGWQQSTGDWLKSKGQPALERKFCSCGACLDCHDPKCPPKATDKKGRGA